MSTPRRSVARVGLLQWVHGPITVVMLQSRRRTIRPIVASMGPRSDNRGYASRATSSSPNALRLQWVHGPITVVMPRRPKSRFCPGFAAVVREMTCHRYVTNISRTPSLTQGAAPTGLASRERWSVPQTDTNTELSKIFRLSRESHAFPSPSHSRSNHSTKKTDSFRVRGAVLCRRQSRLPSPGHG